MEYFMVGFTPIQKVILLSTTFILGIALGLRVKYCREHGIDHWAFRSWDREECERNKKRLNKI